MKKRQSRRRRRRGPVLNVGAFLGRRATISKLASRGAAVTGPHLDRGAFGLCGSARADRRAAARRHLRPTRRQMGPRLLPKDEDRMRTMKEARGQCNKPYVITKGPTGGVMMYLADQSEPQELVLKGAQGGKTYVGRLARRAARTIAKSSTSTPTRSPPISSIRTTPIVTARWSMSVARAGNPKATQRPDFVAGAYMQTSGSTLKAFAAAVSCFSASTPRPIRRRRRGYERCRSTRLCPQRG